MLASEIYDILEKVSHYQSECSRITAKNVYDIKIQDTRVEESINAIREIAIGFSRQTNSQVSALDKLIETIDKQVSISHQMFGSLNQLKEIVAMQSQQIGDLIETVAKLEPKPDLKVNDYVSRIPVLSGVYDDFESDDE